MSLSAQIVKILIAPLKMNVTLKEKLRETLTFYTKIKFLITV